MCKQLNYICYQLLHFSTPQTETRAPQQIQQIKQIKQINVVNKQMEKTAIFRNV